MITSSLENLVLEKQQLNEMFCLVVNARREIRICPIFSMEADLHSRLKVKGWFLPEFVEILKEEPHLTLMVLNTRNRHAYEVKGTWEEMKHVSFLDDLSPQEDKSHFPQVEWELSVHIDAIRELRKV